MRLLSDPRTGNPYPPSAQHALRQGRVVANNLILLINRRSAADVEKVLFDYKAKGMMSLIGKRNGVGIMFGHNVRGFASLLALAFIIFGKSSNSRQKTLTEQPKMVPRKQKLLADDQYIRMWNF